MSIRIFLADGTAEGLRLVEKSNWNGLAVMCSRAQYTDVRGRPEFARPGVYLLFGPSTASSGRQTIYIGQADIARERLDNHHRNRDFWTHVILFVSRDTTLNKAHVQYLESKLIDRANQARRVDVENGNAPREPFLSEADRADADTFLDDMLLIYPVLGISAFEVVAPAKGSTQLERQDTLYLRTADAAATGRDTPEGFIVFSGSTGRASTVPSLQDGYRELRESLLKKGIFVEQGGQWLMAQDYSFDSPTQAAAVLSGRTANGRIEWKDAQGRTLKERQEMALGDATNGQ